MHCIHFPKPNELDAVGKGFAALAQNEAFRKCVGAIDGCHIRIKAPAGPAPSDYVNRKLFCSIQLQAVCDSGDKFLDTFSGYPGSVHDTRVLKNSPSVHKSPVPSRRVFHCRGWWVSLEQLSNLSPS